MAALMQAAGSLDEAEALLQAAGIRSELAVEREHYDKVTLSASGHR